jgi:hypothetical protein
MTQPLPPGAAGPQLVHGDPPVDFGNKLLSIVPVNLTVSLQETPAGQRLAVTVRTVDTTLTVFLAKDEVEAWQTALASGKAGMTGLILGNLG